jgi:hypothetical protein
MRVKIFVSSLILLNRLSVGAGAPIPAPSHDANIETLRIKLSDRDSAVWTPDESGWFRALPLSSFRNSFGVRLEFHNNAVRFEFRLQAVCIGKKGAD